MLTIGHLNICSLRNKVADLQTFFSHSNIHKNRYDIFGISESRLHEQIPENILQIQDYHLFRKDATSAGETGLAVYVKDTLKQSVIFRKDLYFKNIECMWIEIITKKKKSPQLVCFLYRNGKTKLSDYCKDFINMLDHITQIFKSPEILIMGDFNIDLVNPPHKWMQTLRLHNLISLINTPTRITHTTATCIDHCYTNTKKGINNFGIDTLNISDHSLIFCSKSSNNIQNLKNGHTYIQFRSMKHFNQENFLKELLSLPFDNILSTSNPDSALDIFYSLFLSVLNKHAPMKKKRIKNSELPKFQSPELINEMRRRDELKKNNLIDEWKKSKNKCKVLKTKSEKQLFQNIVKENSNKPNPNVSIVWKALNILINKNSARKNDCMQFTHDEFNDFFLSIPKTLLNSNSFDNYNIPEELIQFCENRREKTDEFKIPSLTSYDIEQIINALPNKKSGGIDEINTHILKITKEIISPSLTYIFNLCLSKNYFPVALKTAKIIPLKKVKSPTSISEYRPIALLPILSKIFEKHINKHLMKFLEKRNLIHILQSGFRENHSCSTALNYITNSWLNSMNNGNMSGVVFLDFSKAFDMINHTILLEKLPLYLGKSTLGIFSSFLSNRSQQVYINGSLSKLGKVEFGVPQGSVLGPILFSLYINDLPLILSQHNTECHMLADDTTISYENTSIERINSSLQISLNEISQWCKNNHMVLNSSKTKTMVIATTQKHSRYDLKLNLQIDDKNINQVKEHKLLGVTIDEQLKWNSHINSVSKKVSKTLYLMHRLRNIIDTDTKILFFNAFIRSHFDYCSTIWDSTDKCYLQKLISLHKRSIKLILTENKTMSTQEKMNSINILSLENQHKLNKGINIFKTLNNKSPKYLKKIVLLYLTSDPQDFVYHTVE